MECYNGRCHKNVTVFQDPRWHHRRQSRKPAPPWVCHGGAWLCQGNAQRWGNTVVPTLKVYSPKNILGGGFIYFLFSSLPGRMIQFDKYFVNGLKPPTSIVDGRNPVNSPVDMVNFPLFAGFHSYIPGFLPSTVLWKWSGVSNTEYCLFGSFLQTEGTADYHSLVYVTIIHFTF